MKADTRRTHRVEEGHGIYLQPLEGKAYWAIRQHGSFVWPDKVEALLRAEVLSRLSWVQYAKVSKITVYVVED